MRRVAAFTAALIGLIVGTSAAAQAAPEIVVAMRYLTPTGTSHAHLYLYREDGKFLRQLTRDDSGQDKDPVFAPDGETIVFTREKPGITEYWSIRPLGTDLRRLPSAPAWYRSARTSPYFTNFEVEGATLPGPATGDKAPHVRAPDGSVELVLRSDPTDLGEDADINGPGHGKHYLLRDLKTGKETELGKLPGFLGLFDLLHIHRDATRFFLFEGPLRLAFFGLHLDSTAGDTAFALDLNTKRLVRLSPNWAAPIPLPGEPGFLTRTEVRYVPFSSDGKTENSAYIEHWDAQLHKIRYANSGAALCYGASLYRPGMSPAVITFRSNAE